MRLTENYEENVLLIKERLRVAESFDMIERHLTVGGCDVTFFYIDGFTKDSEMQRLMQYLLSKKELPSAGVLISELPYIEVNIEDGFDAATRAVLSGQTLMLAPTFCKCAVIFDARTYPARGVTEPELDKVIAGSRDGFVETLVMNTALIRRRIRDPRLTMRHFSVGTSSATDVVLCYMDGVADEALVAKMSERLKSIRPRSISLGYRSLAEALIRRGWHNPFPKIRTTERPDTASAQLMEGSVLILCDNSPQVMLLPTSIFDYIGQTEDYYLPPLTGTYLRLVRTLILIISALITPVWYLAVEYADKLPESLSFVVPEDPGALPIIFQLFLVEIAIDGLKIASMNTPDLLASSLSVVGALLLGDFAVGIGWVCPDVILYMAFVAIAGFAQQSIELGYAIKYMRMTLLLLVYLFKLPGLVLGSLLFLVLLVTNSTLSGGHGYLYPLIPFSPRALLRVFVRVKKHDFENSKH